MAKTTPSNRPEAAEWAQTATDQLSPSTWETVEIPNQTAGNQRSTKKPPGHPQPQPPAVQETTGRSKVLCYILIVAAIIIAANFVRNTDIELPGLETIRDLTQNNSETLETTENTLPIGSQPSNIQNPAQRHLELKQLMLRLTNERRAAAGAPPVRLGQNPAAQIHAEEALKGCYSAHWDRWGLKPNHRYTMTGGTGADAENGSGLDYCIQPDENYSPNRPMETEVAEIVQGWMDSPGHRRTLLDPAHTVLNIGIAHDRFNTNMVQQFSSDYVRYTDRPSLSPNGTLTFSGTVQEATLDIHSATNFAVTWHPPPQPLTRGQLAHTYSLCNDRMAGLLRKSLSGNRIYTESNNIETVPVKCINPYANDPDRRGPRSNKEAHEVWAKAKAASQDSTATRTETAEWITAGSWNIQNHSFNVAADISILTKKHGPGIYSLIIWGRPDHMTESTVISKQAIFWGIDPPEGNPYGTALAQTPAPLELIQGPTPVMLRATAPDPNIPVIKITAPDPNIPVIRIGTPDPNMPVIRIGTPDPNIPVIRIGTPDPNMPRLGSPTRTPTPTQIPRYTVYEWSGLQMEIPWGWVGTAGFMGDLTFGNSEGTAGVEVAAENWKGTEKTWQNFLQERLDQLLADAREAIRAGVDNPYQTRSAGPAGPDLAERIPDAWEIEYLMQRRGDQCVQDVVELLAPHHGHTRGIRVTTWICQEDLDGQKQEDRDHMLRSFR